MSDLSILIIDNKRSRSQSLKMLLEFMDFAVDSISQLSAIESLDKQFDLIIYGDNSLVDFLSFLRELTTSFPQIPFLLLENNQPLPLDSIKQQYPLCLGLLNEPFKQGIFLSLIADLQLSNNEANKDKVLATVDPELSVKPLTENTDPSINPYLEQNLIGQSSGMKRVRKLIQQVANSNANVLILGESGTGKEVVARCVHKLSKRHNQSYVPVNCGAIPADLLESELFGHEKGAFTGAINSRQGRFELAQGGTLFLDEIGDMPLGMQVKILRILQEKMFERVGGNKSIVADVRILAATHRNLEDRVTDGSFREDLFYRLNVFPIEIPPLKERVSDLPLLIDFINKSIVDERDEQVNFSEQALASIFLHSWPGNIRELGNLVERLAIMFGSEIIQYDDLPEKYQYDIDDFDFSRLSQYEILHEAESPVKQQEVQEEASIIEEEQLTIDSTTDIDYISQQVSVIDLSDDGVFDLKEHLGNLEQTLIEDALSKSNGVVAHAAKRLNIRRTTLVEKMRKYGISGK
jgi:sigma-54 dependent transcriptional regulator, flagellar regulatory protein